MEDLNKKVITRFAPSPTGFMHAGNVRTALFAFLWARKNNGTFILRIEDTDKDREVEGSIAHIIESLKWLGINWDEGPNIGGPHAPYMQSQRLELYKKYAQKLIDADHAYSDPYTEDELESFRKKAEENKEAFLFRNYRPETFEKWDGTKPLRFKTPEIKTFKWHDVARGDLSAGPEALDDFILIKSDGYPTYNFAHIVDDIEMNITHVMRGQEFISSTPKYLSVYEALGIKPPLFVTMPPIMADGGEKKLGKRDGAKDVLAYKTDGYLPEALVNFLALLGWNPGHEKEIFTEEELIKEFDIERVQKSGAQMNLEKLDWMNKEHIKKLSKKDLENKIDEWMPESIKKMPNYSRGVVSKITPIIAEHISKFGDIKDMSEAGNLSYFFEIPKNLNLEKIIWKNLNENAERKNITANHLKKVLEILKNISEKDFTAEKIKEAIWSYAEEVGRGDVLWPTRYALSGMEKSPDPFTLAGILGKNDVLARLSTAVGLLEA